MVASPLSRNHGDESAALLRYILLSAGEQSLDEVRKTILLHIPAAEAPMASAGEELIRQGFQRGIQQGVQQGIQQGVQQGIQQGQLTALREMLSSLLTARFGPLTNSMLASVEAAQVPELKRMLLRVTDAVSVDEVLSAG